MKNLLELKNINKMFSLPGGGSKTGPEALILKQIELCVKEGEFLAVLGPSGSGKSTLLRIIAGLVPPTSGTVAYLGEPIQGINPGVGMVFQSFALFPWLTVLENVLLGLDGHELSRSEKLQKAMEVLDIVGLDGFENAYPKELSGGMRQRVGIGRALVSEPDILLMDEPFSALDAITREEMQDVFLDLWQASNITTMLVTHYVEEALYLGQQIVRMSSQPGAVSEIMDNSLSGSRERRGSPEFFAMGQQLRLKIKAGRDQDE